MKDRLRNQLDDIFTLLLGLATFAIIVVGIIFILKHVIRGTPSVTMAAVAVFVFIILTPGCSAIGRMIRGK